MPGPAIVISFIIAGIGCMFAGLCYSEFAAMVPVAGSAYAYSYATLGEFIAWFVGWNLMLEYMMACSTVAVGWSRYFVKLLEHYRHQFHSGLAELGAVRCRRTSAFRCIAPAPCLNLPAIAIIVAATALCYKGIKESALVNTIIVAIKVGIVIAVIVFGAFYVNTANWHPYIPPNTGTFGEFGWSGILQASAIIFFAYIGFDGVSTVAQEAKDPQRGMPIGMLGSLGICTVLYILMSSVMTGLVPFKQLERRGAGGGRARGAPAACVAVDLGRLGRAVRTDLGDHHHDHPAGAHLADAWRMMACCRSSSAPCIRSSAPRTCPR